MLFNYNTLKVCLHKKTQSIHILLHRPHKESALNIEMLFELEGLLGWLCSHLEIHALYLSSTQEFFCNGFELEELKAMNEKKFYKYLTRFRKITTALQCLPQTCLCNLKGGASGMGLELALACDLRIARKDCLVCFDDLQRGWAPCAGGVHRLSSLVGVSRAQQWQLSGAQVSAQGLLQSGLLLDTYSKEEEEEHLKLKILNRISQQAPVARLQTKKSFFEYSTPQQERSLHYQQEKEFLFALAALKLEDWKKTDSREFTKARELSQKIKENQNSI